MNSRLVLLCICLTVAIGVASALRNSRWSAYKRQFGKTYADRHEEQVRRAILAQSEQQVREHNAKHAEERGFTMAINHLSDWTPEERAKLNGLRIPEQMPLNSPKGQSFIDDILNNDEPVPDSVDWRNVPGRVSEVKNQKNCGSCWAFATTGVLEGQELKQKNDSNKLIELSEQNLVDCSVNNNGCNGGFMLYALQDIKKEDGIDDETSYPYDGYDSDCKFSKKDVAMTAEGGTLLPKGDEEALKKMVAKFGPVAVGMDAMDDLFQYSSGVYYNKHCSSQQLNHGVLVVGYGTDAKQGDYWIIKNSWGETWGDKGFFKIARNKKNHCGVSSFPTVPTF